MTDLARVCFERMRPRDVGEARRRADVAFLPLGSLEWHGVQNPLGTDALKAHRICCMAADKLGGAVFPSVVWGVPRDSFFVSLTGQDADTFARAVGAQPRELTGLGAHGGMDRQEQWLFFQRLLRMSLEHIAGFGFRSIYVCCGHDPLVHWVRPVAIAFERSTRMADRPVTLDWGCEYDAAGLVGDHGGKWETSLMMAADEKLVDLGELTRNPEYRGVGAGTDAVDATREQGEKWMEACASAVAEEARRLVENYPEPPGRHQNSR